MNKIYEFINVFKDKLLEKCENIVGIYLFGSLIYGGFDENSSDIDLIVITKTLLNKIEIKNIEILHKEIIKINNLWGNRLEVSYTPLFMFNEKSIPNIPRPYYNGKFYEKAGYGNEWLINNYLLLNYGKTIYGKDFKEIINYNISIEEIKKCCINDFYKEWNPKINDNDWLKKGQNQAYIVLNICRIIYTLLNNKIGNKTVSAKWVKEKYEIWKNLIEEAEKWNFNKIINRQNDIKEYISYMENIIRMEIE
ncbi:MAG: DUF4111 domain-containing protein [Treponema sp.]|nr:DUF4111 domain-containing protein [Treponema sp.]